MAIPKATYKDHVIAHIYTGIMQNRYRSGDKILEQALSQELEISRAPVREALRELVGEGLLSHAPQRGHYVTALGPTEISNAYETRGVIEGYAASLAAPLLTKKDFATLTRLTTQMELHARKEEHCELIERGEEFHALILDRCPNRELFSFGHKLSRKLHILFCHHWGTLYSAAEVAERHLQIINSLATGDTGTIESTIRQHYSETGCKIAALPDQH